jgi:hypothetical protein
MMIGPSPRSQRVYVRSFLKIPFGLTVRDPLENSDSPIYGPISAANRPPR